MKKNLLLLLLTLTIVSIGCEKDKNTSFKGGGIVICFDDHYIDDWLLADSLFNKYNWKATFGLTEYYGRTNDDFIGLKYLESQGHEIANHGLNHENAIEYINNYGIEAYLKNEVDSMNTLMNTYFNKTTSFVYPNGSHNTELDTQMFSRFSILRGTTASKESPENQQCYFNGSHVVYAWGIDNNYEHYSKEKLTELLNYSKEKELILILYAHRIAYNITIDYQVEISTLDYICNYVVENDMKFLTLSELANL